MKNHILSSPLSLHKSRTLEQCGFRPLYAFPSYITGVIWPKHCGIYNPRHVERIGCYEAGCYREVAVLFGRAFWANLSAFYKNWRELSIPVEKSIIIVPITKTLESCIHSSPITTDIWIHSSSSKQDFQRPSMCLNIHVTKNSEKSFGADIPCQV